MHQIRMPLVHFFETSFSRTYSRDIILVEAAATALTLGAALKGAANEVIDLIPLFKTFEAMKAGGSGGDW